MGNGDDPEDPRYRYRNSFILAPVPVPEMVAGGVYSLDLTPSSHSPTTLTPRRSFEPVTTSSFSFLVSCVVP